MPYVCYGLLRDYQMIIADGWRGKKLEINGLWGKVTTDDCQIGLKETSVHMCEICGKKSQAFKWILAFVRKQWH